MRMICVLAKGCEKFRIFSVEKTALNRKRIAQFVENSLTLVTRRWRCPKK